MRLCVDCGKPIGTGYTQASQTSLKRYARCALCLAAKRLANVRLSPPPREHKRRSSECVCGCGRVGEIVAFGLVRRCYNRLYNDGALEHWKEQRRAA